MVLRSHVKIAPIGGLFTDGFLVSALEWRFGMFAVLAAECITTGWQSVPAVSRVGFLHVSLVSRFHGFSPILPWWT